METFVCLDCETTGLDTENDRIIEMALIVFQGETEIARYETLVDPVIKIPEESTKIHNITNEMVAGKPKIEEVLPEFLNLVSDHIIMGHGIQFDIDVIDASARRKNIPCKIKKNRSIDTLRLARLYGESQVNSLEMLRKHFNIPEEGAHRAMSDVIVNIAVYKQLTKSFSNTEAIFKRLRKPIKLRLMPLGKHKGRLFSEIPIEYLSWAARQQFDQDLLFSLRSEIKTRKLGNSFSQSTNPFSSL